MIFRCIQRRKYLFLVAAILAWVVPSIRLGVQLSPFPTDERVDPTIHVPSSAIQKENITITVLVDLRAGWRDWGFSFLEARQLQLYGRYHYHVEWFHFTDDAKRLQRIARSSNYCVLVSNPKGLEQIRQDHAPNCKTWIINDEYCKHEGDIRHYFHLNATAGNLFVPLGPRYDFDKAYHQHRKTTTSLLPTSQRPIRFNAIFSKNTSPSRKALKALLLQSPKYNSSTTTTTTSEYFIQIPGKWRRQMHPVYHVNSTRYVEILSHSQFTLAPTGHNPECFRIYESILMGSIPIIVIGDDEYQAHPCPNALQPLLESALQYLGVASPPQSNDAIDTQQYQQQQLVTLSIQHPLPFVLLQDWNQLDEVLTKLWEQGPQALDTRQERLSQWYLHFMKEQVWKLEDYLLGNQ